MDLESPAEHSARMAQLQDERQQRRERDLRDQRSIELTPAQRLRLWERLHQLRIPARLQDSLATVIARDTGLSVAEVHAAQAERANPQG